MSRRRQHSATAVPDIASLGLSAGEPEEIAAMVLCLASDEASYSTGGEFVVDGGWLAGDINPLLPGAPART
jgi:NAD(P)-dependent dehydrogenase (short-subunit alcohol dehydrogenase family)